MGVQQTQRLARGREGQSRMQEQADGLVAIVADGAESLGLRMRGVVERGGVLGAEHDGVLAHPHERGLSVSREEVLRVHGVVVEEAVGGFGFGPGAAGLGNGGGGLLGEIGGERDEPRDQALVRQRSEGEFVRGPIGAGGLGR